ncbi:MAG: DUF2490 domain-containing protein [Bacteroidota bacterium]
MRTYQKSLFLSVVLMLLFIPYSKANDFELWTFVGGETKIKDMDLSFHNANFFGHNFGWFLNHTQISLDFPSSKKFSLGVGYKQEYVDFPIRDNWRREYRPMIHLYYKKIWGHFSFRDRNRWEFRFMDGEFINRYRNQLQLSYDRFRNVSPYITTEFNFYFNGMGYTRQRTILGSKILVKRVMLNLFLGHQTDEYIPDKWYSKYMFSTGISYRF